MRLDSDTIAVVPRMRGRREDTVYTIDEFWIPTLGKRSGHDLTSRVPTGWTANATRLNTFVEAPLGVAEEFGHDSAAKIHLVSAPGAVGKSTLAREIAARTGAVLVDLARADAVGAGSITGGLAWSGIFEEFLAGTVALLIDGLDEARIRVTRDSFEAFLHDILQLADSGRKPITLFGRTSAIEDAWLHFADIGIEPTVLEIGFHERETAFEFVTLQVEHLRRERDENVRASRDADHTAATLVLDRLRDRAESDGTRFSGYAPVLIAVATRIATERNPIALVNALEEGVEALSLNDIVDDILDREKTKLERLEFEDSELQEGLYGKAEQVDRLISAVYGIEHVPRLPEMSQNDAAIYRNALENWLPDHPFTDGSGARPSSEVFGGFIAAEALKRAWASPVVRATELGQAKVNPFLWRFRLPDVWRDVGEWESTEFEDTSEGESIPTADLGLVFSSLRAHLPRLASAHLFVDADTDGDSPEMYADVEIDWFFDASGRWIRLRSEIAGTVRFASRVNDVFISGDRLDVVVSGTETTLAAPVYLDVRTIDVGRSSIVVEGSALPGPQAGKGNVYLRCAELTWENDVLFVRPNVDLAVDWPGSSVYPWYEYRVSSEPEGVDAELGERLRRLRKILVLFRARGKGQLAKYKGAIDAERRTRGSGAAVRDLLLQEGVLFEQGRVYVLDTDRLKEVLGLSYQEIRSSTTNAQTIDFLSRLDE